MTFKIFQPLPLPALQVLPCPTPTLTPPCPALPPALPRPSLLFLKFITDIIDYCMPEYMYMFCSMGSLFWYSALKWDTTLHYLDIFQSEWNVILQHAGRGGKL